MLERSTVEHVLKITCLKRARIFSPLNSLLSGSTGIYSCEIDVLGLQMFGLSMCVTLREGQVNIASGVGKANDDGEKFGEILAFKELGLYILARLDVSFVKKTKMLRKRVVSLFVNN